MAALEMQTFQHWFDLSTKETPCQLVLEISIQYNNDLEDYDGYKTSINFAKTSGKYRYTFNGKIYKKIMTTMI
jgi:hypothetical protein